MSETVPDIDKSTNQSTQVAFLIIEKMVEIGEPVALSTLARAIGMPRARVHRFMRTLLALSYVAQDPDTERYRLTLKLFHLGQAIADRTDLLIEARKLMTELRNLTGQTVTLSTVEPEGMRILEIVRADSPVAIVTRPGALLDFHASAQGKVALAFGAPELWDVVRRGPLKGWTERTNTDLAVLEREVAAVRDRGWADAPHETLSGVTALAAPLFERTNSMIGTVTIAGPVEAIGAPPTALLISQVVGAASAISRSLGSTEPF